MRGFQPRAALVALGVSVFLLSTQVAAHPFPPVPELNSAVAFWKNVYAVWSINDIVLHDAGDLSVVYRVLKVPARGAKNERGKTRREVITAGKAELVSALSALKKKHPKNADQLTGVQKEVFLNLAHVQRRHKYDRPKRLRSQNGLREKFAIGYATAGRFDDDMKEILTEAGLPPETIALAYVESLMILHARSWAGAVGPWQFMRPTAREYMQVHQFLDERHDPLLATQAAAKYLLTARKDVGPWPVAITSYNYGRSGVRRLIKSVGSSDLGVLLRRAKNRRFGFAARNYYASLLAVLEVLDDPTAYFPEVKREKSWRYDVVRMPFPVLTTQMVAKKLITRTRLSALNPALRPDALAGKGALPKGMPVRVEAGQGPKVLAALLAFSSRARAQAKARPTFRFSPLPEAKPLRVAQKDDAARLLRAMGARAGERAADALLRDLVATIAPARLRLVSITSVPLPVTLPAVDVLAGAKQELPPVDAVTGVWSEPVQGTTEPLFPPVFPPEAEAPPQS